MGFFVKFHRDGTVSLANRVVGTVKKVAANKWQFESSDLLSSGTFRTRREVRPVAREVHKRITDQQQVNRRRLNDAGWGGQ